MPTPRPWPQAVETVITTEAGLNLDPLIDIRMEALVQPGDTVALGRPVLKDRRRPELLVTAPMGGRVVQLELGAGRRQASLLIQHDEKVRPHQFDVRDARRECERGSGGPALRDLLQASGMWMRFRSRPFGRVPAGYAVPALIMVMAIDTKPLAPDPCLALKGETLDHLKLGLQALATLFDGPIRFCQDDGPAIVEESDRIRIARAGPLHPAGLAGSFLRREFRSGQNLNIWEISAEDVVGIGHLLSEGFLPATRLVSVAGPGLRETRLVRCQPGADLRELCHAHMKPGPHTILSGSALDGREARWLGWRARQVTVLERRDTKPQPHWLESALRRASRPEPVIATSAVEHALGGAMPGMALLRALAIGDDETAAELGALSLLEEDLALVDYVTAASPRFADLLRACLDRIEAMT
ncbi:Na(+)-translocating NADH-quinone reductase subunit A [Aquamicrobium zhengzhouense]|uniref:Na(+)-translocating NADH-quinone reductase subunit A n=1 Tax=Aquamicrobium zhengzhouense TaxID=2781738 RepID=A0ABS0SDF8_9HYPH|nr:Na(+)-translocating NADH-quinone reductase subunit A [Aquamicrobium zhengzhouense]MBI1620814.1 Na(+)-translocating NADH-quinone reductase subunit A [Aquamicrobium zhengzhouense]